MTVLLTAVFCSPGQAMQVGVFDDDSGFAIAARTQISQPSVHYNGNYGHFYWVGVTFPNGDFFQTGYMDATYNYQDLCQTGFSTFTTALKPHVPPGGNPYLTPSAYNETHCNLTGSHYFKVARSSDTASGVTWQSYIDGIAIGPGLDLPESQYHFARNSVSVVSEIANGDGDVLNSSSGFATVSFYPTLSVEQTTQGGFATSTGAYATVAGPYYNCNWFAMQKLGSNNIKTGKPGALGSTPCWSTGDVLWS